MEKLALLEEKVGVLIDLSNKLKNENEKNLKEIEYLRTDNTRAEKLIQENEALLNQKSVVKAKLNELLDKFSKLGV